MNYLAVIGPVVAVLGAIGGLFLKRHYDRKDAQENRIAGSYQAVLESLGVLRSTGKQLAKFFDFKEEHTQAEFAPLNEAIKKAQDLIETKRLDTGSAFADAAQSIVDYWEELSNDMWHNDYNAKPLQPPRNEREATLLAAIPNEHRKRVAEGHLAELKTEGLARSKS